MDHNSYTETVTAVAGAAFNSFRADRGEGATLEDVVNSMFHAGFMAALQYANDYPEAIGPILDVLYKYSIEHAKEAGQEFDFVKAIEATKNLTKSIDDGIYNRFDKNNYASIARMGSNN